MAKINKGDFTSKRPVLTQDDLEEQVAVLTISNAEVIDVPDDEAEGGTRKSIVLSFEEAGEKVLWPSSGDITTIIDKLGDDTDEWVGTKLPVEKVTRKFKGVGYKKVGVLSAEEWDTYIKPKRTPLKVAKGGKKR